MIQKEQKDFTCVDDLKGELNEFGDGTDTHTNFKRLHEGWKNSWKVETSHSGPKEMMGNGVLVLGEPWRRDNILIHSICGHGYHTGTELVLSLHKRPDPFLLNWEIVCAVKIK